MAVRVICEEARKCQILQLRKVLSKLLPSTPMDVLRAVVHEPLSKNKQRQRTDAAKRGHAALTAGSSKAGVREQKLSC